MRILLSICLCICGVLAQNHQLTKIMQDMEYAMEQMQRGFLYNKKEWIDAGLNDLTNHLHVLILTSTLKKSVI